jgi:hypothetical protein
MKRKIYKLKMNKRHMNEKSVLIIFVFVFVFCSFMIVIENIKQTSITGYATSATATSNVTIITYLSISLSTNLSSGIVYNNGTGVNDGSNIELLNRNNYNATHNFDAGAAPPNASSYFVNVSPDSNVNVDLCLKALANLCDQAVGCSSAIAVANTSYANSSHGINNFTWPSQTQEVKYTLGGVKAGESVTKGNATYYRFWFDAPPSIAAATYNNTVSFEGVSAGGACT